MGRQTAGRPPAPNFQGGMTRPQGLGGGMGRQLGGMAQQEMQRPEVQQGMQKARGWLQGAGMPQTMAEGSAAATPMPQPMTNMGAASPPMPQPEGGDMRAQLAGVGGGFGNAQPVGVNRPPALGMQPPANPQLLAQMLQQRK